MASPPPVPSHPPNPGWYPGHHRCDSQESPRASHRPGVFLSAGQSRPRRVRSVCSCHFASASVPGRAYLLRVRIDA